VNVEDIIRREYERWMTTAEADDETAKNVGDL
jgi:hypothetical protein